jgi:hypothetical protein
MAALMPDTNSPAVTYVNNRANVCMFAEDFTRLIAATSRKAMGKSVANDKVSIINMLLN